MYKKIVLVSVFSFIQLTASQEFAIKSAVGQAVEPQPGQAGGAASAGVSIASNAFKDWLAGLPENPDTLSEVATNLGDDRSTIVGDINTDEQDANTNIVNSEEEMVLAILDSEDRAEAEFQAVNNQTQTRIQDELRWRYSHHPAIVSMLNTVWRVREAKRQRMQNIISLNPNDEVARLQGQLDFTTFDARVTRFEAAGVIKLVSQLLIDKKTQKDEIEKKNTEIERQNAVIAGHERHIGILNGLFYGGMFTLAIWRIWQFCKNK